MRATLEELQDLLLDTAKLKSRYQLGLVAISLAPQKDHSSTISAPVQGILGHAISYELRADIMYCARLIHSKNSFPKRLWCAAVDKSKFEELVERIRFFIRQLSHLFDPLRQDDMSQSMQMVLSHVIGMSGRMD